MVTIIQLCGFSYSFVYFRKFRALEITESLWWHYQIVSDIQFKMYPERKASFLQTGFSIPPVAITFIEELGG
jgi:hypothetical protein